MHSRFESLTGYQLNHSPAGGMAYALVLETRFSEFESRVGHQSTGSWQTLMKRREYLRDELAEAARSSVSVCEVMRKLGVSLAGARHAHITERLRHFSVDTSHFLGKAHGKDPRSRRLKTPDQILIARPKGGGRAKTHHLRRALLASGVAYECKLCGQEPMWRGLELTLDIDHEDGDRCNDSLGNLRFLCPNCHATTGTFKNKAR